MSINMITRRCAGLWSLSVVLVLESCNAVLENRQDCPCTLSVVMEDVPEYPVRLYVNGEWAGEALCDTTLQVWVERGTEASVLAISGMYPDEAGLADIPYGDQCPPVYVFSGMADCRQESGSIRVVMQKHFSTLSLNFGGKVPFQAEVRGCVKGLAIPEGDPLPGEFHCRLDDDFCCRLPRQREDDQLWLDIVLNDGVLRSFPLDAYLRASAFDWEAPDLGDISLQVDLSATEICFARQEWGSAFPLLLTI